MPSAILVRTVVFDQQLYRGNGDVHRWCRKITDRFGREASEAAPVRTGELAEGIITNTRQTGERQVEGTITSTAPHTMYVLRGTTGPIMSNRGWRNRAQGPMKVVWKGKGSKRKQIIIRNKGYMKLNTADAPPGTPIATFKWEVSGQDANNFLATAWARTARDHRAIRGRGVPSFISNL